MKEFEMAKKAGRPMHGKKPKIRVPISLDEAILKKLKKEGKVSTVISKILEKYYKEDK